MGQNQVMICDGVSEAVLEYVQRTQVALGVCAVEDYVAQVSAIWSCIRSFPRFTNDIDASACATAMYRIAAGFFSAHRHPQRLHPSSHPTMRRTHINNVLGFTRAELGCPQLKLETLASRMRLSLGYLSRALAAETAYPFRTHVNGMRLLAAVLRFHDPSLTIGCIAREVGYVSTGELDRQFDRCFGLSPRRFAALIRDIPEDRLAP